MSSKKSASEKEKAARNSASEKEKAARRAALEGSSSAKMDVRSPTKAGAARIKKPVVMRFDWDGDWTHSAGSAMVQGPPSLAAPQTATEEEVAARRAQLQTSATVRRTVTSGGNKWAVVRKSEPVSKALANRSWGELVRAIKENDSRLTEAHDELARAKDHLAALDAKLADWGHTGKQP